MFSLFLLLSCARSASPELEAAAEVAPEPLPDLPEPTPAPKPGEVCGEGSASLTPPLEQAWTALMSGAAGERIQVVITLAEGAVAPAFLEEQVVVGALVQGWISTERLCELASSSGVEAVREPIEARPK